MRLSVYQIQTLEPEILADLFKIGAPEIGSEAELEQWLQGQLAEHKAIYAAKFNGKYIAFAVLDSKTHAITYFAVREATRRRGVGKELMRQLKLQTTATELYAKAAADSEFAAFLIAQGFSQSATDEFVWS